MTKRYISPNDTPDTEVLLELRITTESLTSMVKAPPSVEKHFAYFLENLRDKPSVPKIRAEVLPKLEKLIEQYPDIPPLYNYLSAALELLGEDEKVDVLLEEQYRKNPQYVFARLNYGYNLFSQGRTDEIPELLAHKFTLQELFPERKEFHVSEVCAFAAFMGLYQYILGHRKASDAWLELASMIDSENIQIRKVKSIIQGRSKKFAISKLLKSQGKSNEEHFPPSMNLIFMTPEQILIDIITPFLPIPCTVQPHTAKSLASQQGIFLQPTTQLMITSVFDAGHEGGVVCTIDSPKLEESKRDLVISITHLIIKPKHKAAIRIQEYQRKRNAQLRREHGQQRLLKRIKEE
jgi:hypothetical protein